MSLPSWERGLKYLLSFVEINNSKSLPSWERGLKYPEDVEGLGIQASLPSWERGLKSFFLTVRNASHIRRSPRGSVD